ncbi:hypothetical protein NFI96_031706 [Prochilodus magdalenae]|nr:hypothetical protein NFI96_031706 [Prochilodus magdalenae]
MAHMQPSSESNICTTITLPENSPGPLVRPLSALSLGFESDHPECSEQEFSCVLSAKCKLMKRSLSTPKNGFQSIRDAVVDEVHKLCSSAVVDIPRTTHTSNGLIRPWEDYCYSRSSRMTTGLRVHA